MSKTTIQASPTAFDFDIIETALLIVDVQKDSLSPGGYGEFLGNNPALLQGVVAPISNLLKVWRQLRLPVVHTREGHKPDLSDCPATKLTRWPEGTRIGDRGPMGRILVIGEEGQAIIDELKPAPGEIAIDKPGKNAFIKTNLESVLRSIRAKTLLIAGVTTDVSVLSTVAGANDLGFNAVVLQDCVASYNPSRHQAALEIITAQGGIFGWVTSSSEILNVLQAMQVR